MPQITDASLRSYRFRARLPHYLRIASIAAILIALVIAAAEFYRQRTQSPFRLKSEHAQLSKDVVAEVNGYERTENENGAAKYYIKADHAVTFSDDHQEFQNVYLEVYAPDGSVDQKLTAESGLYVPEPDKNFTAYLRGKVNVETKDGLKVQTTNVVYTKSTDLLEADEAVDFQRENIRGRSIGAKAKLAERKLDLLRDVQIETFESSDMVRSNLRYASVTSVSASFDQTAGVIQFADNVKINAVSREKAQNTDISADRAVTRLSSGDPKEAQVQTFELFDNVRIVSVQNGGQPTNIEAGYALYDKPADRFDLKRGAHIVTSANDKPTDIRASEAAYERGSGRLQLNGDAQVVQGTDYLKADSISAQLFPDNKIKDAVMRGNASARQTAPDRTTTVSAPELNASFNDSRELRDANAVGQSSVEVVPAEARDYSKINATAARGIGVLFKGAGALDKMRTDGRTTILLSPAGSGEDAAAKKLTADAVSSVFSSDGRSLQKAEAVGNAQLYVEPVGSGPAVYRTTIDAPRFDCAFYETGNNVRSCVASKKVKGTRVPTVASERRGTQTLTSDQMTANFGPAAKDVEVLEAVGNAKFSELDRSAVARQFMFTRADETVRLRGGEPTVWDSRARAKAHEIDWNTSANKSFLSGGVSTTYYSSSQMRGASPFSAGDKPVFVTSETAEFDHGAETGLFVTNARGWQENNYVRGDRIFIDQRAGQLIAEGDVQSAIYNARVKQKGKESTAPTFASANKLTYSRDGRVLSYRDSVDIRQGTDRITAGSADVFMNERNEVSKTVAEHSVIITQPTRKATGEWAQYTADDEVAILRGNPATVTDAENGSSQSGEITFNMRENRVLADGRTKQSTAAGRSRSVYKIKNIP